jgi:multidrug efflux pump subunit AcrB
VMFVFVGRDFYPAIDGGMIQLHVRAPPGTRIETTEQIFQKVEDKIREIIPRKDLDLIVDNFGLPAVSYNWAFADGTTIAVNDGVIMVSLKEGHTPTAFYVRKLREMLPAAFPEDLFYFQPAEIATQILNFGVTAQIDVRTVGYDRANNFRIAGELRRRIAAIPGIVDAHLRCCDLGRTYPHSAGADDCWGDDRRHDPDGDRRPWRGAERRPRARGDRRSPICNPDHPPGRAVPVCDAAQGQ